MARFSPQEALADARRGLRLAWYRADREAMAFALMIGAVAVVFGFALQALFAHQEGARERVLESERQALACLARNVYFEARGEPPEGQYAVAEVTMNRVASGRYPDTVCGVVHEQRWDPIRKRFVGAFAWTEFYALPEPAGEAWEFAQKVAAEAYFRRVPPQLRGATLFHATYIRPSWAKERTRVARIGGHVFYR